VEPAIFITYSSKDQKVARSICSALENRGLGCWISSRDIKPGQNFQEQIVKAIRAAKIMVLVFTANANNSNEIKKELALASQNNLIVIPVRMQDVAPADAFAYELATRQWIDLFDDWEASIARLVELIATTIHDHPSADRAKAGAGLGPSEEPQRRATGSAAWVLPTGIAAACVVVLVIAAVAYLKIVRPTAPQTASVPSPQATKLAAAQDARHADPPPPAAPKVPAEPGAPQDASQPPPPKATGEPSATHLASTHSSPAPAAPNITAAPETRQASALVPEAIPFMSGRSRNSIRTDYLPAADHKALAISTGPFGLSTGQADDESAKTAALAACQQRADALAQPPVCELYAIGDTVVYARGHPPVPPPPWFTRDPSIEIPVVIDDIPLIGRSARTVLEKYYLAGRKPKALAIASSGSYAYNTNQENADEAARRALEACGFHAGLPCRIIALDDNFVIPIPTTMKPVGFFQPAAAQAITPELRTDLARRLGNAVDGWSAVAAGSGGRVGLMSKAASERQAIDGALADCAKQDRSCRVIAVGPFAVEPL
jgi:TIR domain